MLRHISLSQTSVFCCEQQVSLTFTVHKLFRSRIVFFQSGHMEFNGLTMLHSLITRGKNIPVQYHQCVELCSSESVCRFSTSAVLLPVGGQRLSAILLLRCKLRFRIDTAFILSRCQSKQETTYWIQGTFPGPIFIVILVERAPCSCFITRVR